MKPVVLIATADQAFLAHCERHFSAAGYAVASVSGGLECWTWLRRVVPSVLILDMELPWGGGDGVLARLREEQPAQATVPVVLLTDNTTSAAAPRLLVPPVFAYYHKPVPPDVLAAAVQSARAG
jgi:DNA-binding response OmpR family regulator